MEGYVAIVTVNGLDGRLCCYSDSEWTRWKATFSEQKLFKLKNRCSVLKGSDV